MCRLLNLVREWQRLSAQVFLLFLLFPSELKPVCDVRTDRIVMSTARGFKTNLSGSTCVRFESISCIPYIPKVFGQAGRRDTTNPDKTPQNVERDYPAGFRHTNR